MENFRFTLLALPATGLTLYARIAAGMEPPDPVDRASSHSKTKVVSHPFLICFAGAEKGAPSLRLRGSALQSMLHNTRNERRSHAEP
jgi:hypothetical protein